MVVWDGNLGTDRRVTRKGRSSAVCRALGAGVLLIACSTFLVAGEESVTLRPMPGVNDGTDLGGAGGGKDTYTFGTNPDANFGRETVVIGQPTSDCNHASGIAYLEFDLAGLPRQVRRVFLGVTHVPHTDHCRSNCAIEVYFYRIDQSWDEMSVTYNHSPRLGPAVFGPVRMVFPNDPGTVEYDITDIYQDWQSGRHANHGLAFRSPTVGCNNSAAFFGFYSSDHPDPEKRPYLRVIPDSGSSPGRTGMRGTPPSLSDPFERSLDP